METRILNGNHVAMRTTHPKHYQVNGSHATSQVKDAKDFHSILQSNIKSSIQEVNSSQIKADQLAIELVTKPNEVSAHEVMIATEKAQLSINLTKAILTRAVTAFQTITSLR